MSKTIQGVCMDMRKYIAALCALCLLLFGGAALSETEIILSDAGVQAGAGVEVDGGAVAITQSGSYRLTGTMSEGSIFVDADDVELVWDGAQLSCSTAAPLTARGDVVLTLAENGGSISDLRRARDMDADGAAIDAGGEVTVRGEGALTVVGQTGHGLRAAGLRVEGGALSVLAEGDGAHLTAEDGAASFALAGGQFAAETGGRGLYVDGGARIEAGDLRVESDADGLYVEEALTISGGAAQLSAGGGASSSTSPTASYFYEDLFGYDPFDFFFGGSYPGGYGGYGGNALEARGCDAVSAAEIAMEDGSLVLDASGDALRADGALTMTGGALSITCGGDGLRAGGDVVVSGGVIWVDECETGLSGANVSVENAEVSIVSADAGISALSERGGDASVLEGAKLTIAAGGDGIAAGADVHLAGGETSICCAGGNGAPLNAGGEVFADGGTLVATGRSDASAIAEDPAQAVLRARFNGTLRAGVRVVVEDEDGQTAFSFEPEADFSRLLLTSPALKQGGTYTLYVEGEALGMAAVDGAETYFRGDFTEERDERETRDDRSEDDGRDAEPSMENGAERI